MRRGECDYCGAQDVLIYEGRACYPCSGYPEPDDSERDLSGWTDDDLRRGSDPDWER